MATSRQVKFELSSYRVRCFDLCPEVEFSLRDFWLEGLEESQELIDGELAL